jgi:hypothetical protein
MMFGWNTVWDTGAWRYQVHAKSGKWRAVLVNAGGHQPVDQHWIDTGDLSPTPKSPLAKAMEGMAKSIARTGGDVKDMTVRDAFAAQALAGLIARGRLELPEARAALCDEAYALGIEMLAARRRLNTAESEAAKASESSVSAPAGEGRALVHGQG